MSRHVTFHEAAHLLGISLRTVQRRVNATGPERLPVVVEGGRRLVVLPDEVLDATARDTSDTGAPSDTDATRDTPTTALVALQTELAAVKSERDFLRETVSRLLANQAHLLADRAPPALPSPPPRRRWRFPWHR